MSRATTQKTDQSKTTLAASGPPAGQAVMCAERHLAAEAWLLAAAPRTNQFRREWNEGGAAFPRCRDLSTALRVPAAVVFAAAGTGDPHATSGFPTEEVEEEPVIAHHGATPFSFLMPARTGRRPAPAPGPDHLAARTWLGAPTLRATCPQGAQSCRPVPMTGIAELCNGGLVARLVQRGHHSLGGGGDR
ncbi:hypothetical protein [Streptomyces sp. NPDC017890]|uniref:hypothetical protein n=1 Tax=Streptomyces sp. NPDC017890 TaxID=3365015 RepID=UPI0037A68E1F